MSRKPAQAKAAPEPRRRLSGWCNPTLPRTPAYDPHQNCRGCDCRAAGCPCNPQETPVDDDPDNPSPESIQRNREQYAACIAAWPEAHDDGYDPRCCRFPKACSIPNDPDRTEPSPPDVEDAVAWARSAADAVNTRALGYNPEDWRDALRLLIDLRKVTDTLAKVDANLVRWLYLHGEHGQHQHADGIAGEFAIGRRRSKENWAGNEGVKDYVGACIEANGGEHPDPEQVVEWVLEVVPSLTSGGLRKTPLRDKGLDPQDYMTSEPGSLYVDVPRGS